METTSQINELKARIVDLQTDNEKLSKRVTTLESDEYKRIEQAKKDGDSFSDSDIEAINDKLEDSGLIRLKGVTLKKEFEGSLGLALLNDNLQDLYFAIESIMQDLSGDLESIHLSESDLSEAQRKAYGLKAVVDIFNVEICNAFNKLDVISIEDIIKQYGITTLENYS